MSETEDEDAGLEPVEIGTVGEKLLADICVKSLREQGFRASVTGGRRRLWSFLFGGLAGSYSIVVPREQAQEARAYLQRSRLLGPGDV